ncbi:hypothetical protein K438DRAFT_1972094 [Mycena galopus ATCC 62051]|nr:hypothetical protein K438DRAFT_1972094 [Mycena galopus ATCC 62051]
MKSTFLQLILWAAGVAFAQTTSKTGILTSSSTHVTSTSSSTGVISNSTSVATGTGATGTSTSVGSVPTDPAAAPNPNAAFASVVSNWATVNQWSGRTGSDNLPVLLVPTAVTNTTAATAPVQVQFGCGYFEVETVYSQGENSLKNCSVFLVVPLWGRTQLLGPQDVPLNSSVGLPVNITGVVNGTIKFFVDPTEGTEILMGWQLDTPFAGTLDEGGLSVFPESLNTYFTEAQLQGVRVFSEAEVEALNGPRPPFSIIVPADATVEQQLLQQFIQNFVVDAANGTIAVQTVSANQYTIDVSFLSILEVSGSVDPSSLSASITLYVKIPLAGRVSLTKIEGSLINGLIANINVVLASGQAVLSAQVNGNGKHDLFINASLDIRFVGTFKTPGNFKILTLP